MPIFTPIIDVPHTPYCGPTAVSILTGVPLSHIEKMLRRKRKGWKRAIKGTYTWEIIAILKSLGCKIEKFPYPETTFGKFVSDTEYVSTPFLVSVTGHFMVSCKGLFSDNSNTNPIPIMGYPKAGRHVKRAWRVLAPATPRYSAEQPAMTTPCAPKLKVDIKAVRAKRIAEQVAQWEAKEKRAKNALKKLRPKLAYYQKLGALGEQTASL